MDRPQDYESCYWSSNLHASTIFNGSLDQLAEHVPLKDGVKCPIPLRPTISMGL